MLPVCVLLILSSYIPFALAANDGGNPDIPNTGDYGNDTPSGNTVTIDANVQGYVGQREGVAGNLAVNYMF